MAIARGGGSANAMSQRRAPAGASLHDIDDLYENNAFDDDDDDHGAQPKGAGSAASPTKRKTSFARHDGDSKAASTSAKTRALSRGADAKDTKEGKSLEFDVWVARKDKYERVAQALARLNTERAADDAQWLEVAVALAATDVLLKTGKSAACDCAGVCREPAHAVTKQRTRCQCPAKRCSLCKRCVGSSPGEITDKMVHVLAPYRQASAQSMLALAERIVATGEGKTLPLDGKASAATTTPKITSGALRMAAAVLAQCSVLQNEDGTRIQRPCACAVHSLGDLWVKWTTRHHTFSRTPLREQDALQFSSGTRQMMEFDEDAKRYYMTLKWHQAAKPQKGDTAKIAARRMLTADQKKQNAFFLALCKSHWKTAQLRVVEHLQAKMDAFHAFPSDKRQRLGSADEYELGVLNALGVKRMLKWVDDDQEAIDAARKDEEREKADGGVVAHHAWVKRKDRLRIRMPTPENDGAPGGFSAAAASKSAAKPGGSWKPPRMDFSSGKGVVRANKHKLPSSTVELMKGSGLKYVHAMNEGFQGRGGDLEKCKQLLLKKGHILKANFDSSGGNGGGGYDDDGGDDNPFSKDRYYFEKQNNPALKKKRAAATQRAEQSKESFAAWTAHKALKEKAVKFLAHIPKPTKDASSSLGSSDDDEYGTGGDGDDDDTVPASVRWEEVGRALKAVDRGLLEDWVRWSSAFANATRCRMLWESFAPIACDVHCTSSAIRDVFLKLLHRKGVNYREAFLAHCDRKHKRALALGVDPDMPDEMSEDDKIARFAALDKKEFARLLQDLGLVLQPEELQRVMEYFDADGNQLVSMREFLDVVGDKRRAQCHGDTDLLLRQVCMWETVCHECGMLNAFQLVIGSTKPGEPRMRAELPGHLKRRERCSARFDCSPECDMLALKKIAPKTCAYAGWTDALAAPSLKKLELWSAEHREQHVLHKMVTEGTAPDAPALFRDDDDALDPTTTLLLRWQPPPVRGNNGAAFYTLETIGAEGTTSFRLNEYREIYRDPRDYKDNDGAPRYHYVVTGLSPNTKYGFRVRALNGFGAGPYTFSYFVTAPATPPAPIALQVTASMIQLGWESSAYYRRQLKELRQVFEEADADGNGQISRDELMEEIERRKPRLLEFLQKTTVVSGGSGGSGASPLSVFDAIETDDNESISWDEFMRFFHGYVDEKCDLEESSRTSSKAGARHSGSSSTSSSSGRSTTSSRRSGGAATTAATSSSVPGDGKAISTCRYILKQCVNEAKGEYVEIYRGAKASFTVHGLASGSTYQFRVQACNEEDMYSLHSSSVVVNTLLQTPAAPVLVESASSATTVKLKWPAASARPCLSHEATQARAKQSAALGGGAKGGVGGTGGDDITRILKEWAQETSVDEGSIDFRAKFDRYDADKSEFIDLPEFKTLLEELGVPATPERMAAYMDEFDADRDGKVSFDEFKRWWTKTDVQYVLKRDRGRVAAAASTTSSDATSSVTSNQREAMTVVSYRGRDPYAIVGGLEPNTEYRFRLRTVSSHASSQLSDAVVVCTPPHAPSCAGMIAVLSSSAQICWYPGRNGAHRFLVECKLVETLPSADTPARRAPAAASGDWQRVYEGSDSLATLTELAPNTVYRLRVFAVNRLGLLSEQSTVAQFCTMSKDEERRRGAASLRPANAADVFVVECTDEGDVVAGDTILFSERLVRSESGKVTGESEVSRTVTSSSDKLTTASVYSVSSYSNGGGASSSEPIGERTVAARVTSVKQHERFGNIVNMVVVWSTVQLYDDVLGKKAATPSVTSRSARMNNSIHTTSHALTLGAGYALAGDLKIARKERALYRYDVFRREWQDERARDPRTWEK